MSRQVFFSFHFDNDFWRTHQVRNIGAIEGNKPTSANAWEEVKKEGNEAIKRWINDKMKNRSCVVVLVGEDTADRPWVRYEIEKGWKEGKGILGIHIHHLKDNGGNKARKGRNPFQNFFHTYENGAQVRLSDIVRCYDPPSERPYNHIRENIADWIEAAIQIRNRLN